MPNILARDVEAYYTGEAGNRYRAVHLAVENDRIYDAIARQRARKLSPYIGPRDRVFEYGVGNGFNLAGLMCGERVGHDVFDNSSELEARGIRFCADPVLFPAASFDVVLCLHTLEHLAGPWAALSSMRRLLKKNGTLLVFVPFETGREYLRFDPTNIHQHLYSWNPQSLGMLLTKAGFKMEVLRVRRFGYDRFTARLLRSSRNDLLYRFVNWTLLRLRPHFEVMAVCRKLE